MARRAEWLEGTVGELVAGAEDAEYALDLRVMRGRAEDGAIRIALQGSDIVVARAVAPLGRLARWALPLLRPGGRLLAIKGSSADEEIRRDADEVRAAGGVDIRVVHCGSDDTTQSATVIEVVRHVPTRPRTSRDRSVRKRKDR
jgi:16S rRNA (guanine527-N7)-methyltransferase